MSTAGAQEAQLESLLSADSQDALHYDPDFDIYPSDLSNATLFSLSVRRVQYRDTLTFRQPVKGTTSVAITPNGQKCLSAAWDTGQGSDYTAVLYTCNDGVRPAKQCVSHMCVNLI